MMERSFASPAVKACHHGNVVTEQKARRPPVHKRVSTRQEARPVVQKGRLTGETSRRSFVREPRPGAYKQDFEDVSAGETTAPLFGTVLLIESSSGTLIEQCSISHQLYLRFVLAFCRYFVSQHFGDVVPRYNQAEIDFLPFV